MHFVHYYPRALVGNGGPTVAMWAWVSALLAAGQRITVVYDADFDGIQPLAVEGVEMIGLKHVLSGRWRTPMGLPQVLSRHSVLVLHSAFLAGNLVADVAARRKGARTIFVPHGAYGHGARQRSALLKRLWLTLEGRVVDSALAVHTFVESETSSIREVAPNVPIVTAPTPVRVPDERWIGGGNYVAWFGRYDIECKGLDLLVEAYAHIPERARIAMRLHGRDSTDTRESVQALVDRAGLRDWISVGGPIEGNAKLDFLRRAEFFVMPSRWESFGIALMEALALGVPSLISGTMAVAERLSAEKACRIVAAEVDALARAMEQMLTSGDASADVFPREFAQRHLGLSAVGQKFASEIMLLCEK